MGNGASVSRRDTGSAVRVVPLRRCLLLMFVALLPWLLVVVGRGICLTAQRVPPLVRLVRRLRRARGPRAVPAVTCPASVRPADGHAIPPQGPVTSAPAQRAAHRHGDAVRLAEPAEHR